MMIETDTREPRMMQNPLPETEPARILVIDDDELTLAILRRLLEAENYIVDATTSAAEALARLPENHYDAILCDMWMGGMNGKEFFLKLKDDFPEYPGRLIYVTGDLASEATWQFIDERHLPYVLKPFNRLELYRKVREIVGERPAPVAPVSSDQPGEVGEKRRSHRITMKANVQVRRKKWAVGGPDVGQVVNASKGGIFFVTERPYRVGMEVSVTFPYRGYDDIEQDGFVVRVEEMSEGQRGVAVALGEEVEAAIAKFAGSKQDSRRHHLLGLPETPAYPSTSGEIAPEAASGSGIGRKEVQRLSEELTDLRTKHDTVIDQRDHMAAEEAKLNKQLQDLTETKLAMTQTLDHLKTQMLSLQGQLSTTEAYRFQATHDALTGLWNRGAILDILRRELLRAQREGSLVGVILADLDHFKGVNDTYGHLVGDAVLQESAQRISAAVRSYDAVGRYGGEEFLIVLSNCDEDAMEQAERIRQLTSAEPIATSQGPISVTLSLGAASTDGLQEVDEILRAADEALYRAKRAGRNRVEPASQG